MKIIKAGVIGDPINHSLSPIIHNYFLKKYNITGSYEAILVKKENLLNDVFNLVNQGFAGFNVTIPHKEEIFKICDFKSKTANLTKAVNTVIVTPDKKLFGHNSDAEGFLNNLEGYDLNPNPSLELPRSRYLSQDLSSPTLRFRSSAYGRYAVGAVLDSDYLNPGLAQDRGNSNDGFGLKNKNAFVIGAGGAARAIIYALIKNGAKVFITNRSEQRALVLIADFKNFIQEKKSNLEFLPQKDFENKLNICDLLVNSTSLGMMGQEPLTINLENLNNSAIVYDIVYKPLETELLKLAKLRRNRTITGIGMLIHQALVGFEAWFGTKPEIDQNLVRSLCK